MATFNDGRWQEEIERLRVLLNDVEHGAWAFARYNDVSVKKQITDQLQRALSVPCWPFSLRNTPDPLAYRQSIPVSARSSRGVIAFSDLEDAIPTVFGYLDLHREAYQQSPHNFLFWVTDYGWREIMAHAPNFYSQRSGVFDFLIPASKAAVAEPARPFTDDLQAQVNEIRTQLLGLEALRKVLGDPLTDAKKAELTAQLEEASRRLVQTSGGAMVGGNVEVRGGTFVGRDQILLGNQYVGVPPDQVPPAVWLAAYYRALANECRRLPLGVIDVKFVQTSGEQPLPLPDIYVDLDVVGALAERGDERTWAGRLARGEGRDRIPLMEAVTDPRRRHLVLLGDAGSGKTTFVNYLTYLLATQDPAAPAALHQALPVRLLLRDVAADHIPADAHKGSAQMIWRAMQDDMRRHLGEEATRLAFPHWQSRLLQEESLFLLDGLDEVPEAHRRRQALREAIQDLRAVLPAERARILVTARPYAYADRQWRLGQFDVLALAPFSAEQQRRFVSRWYQAVAPFMGWDDRSAQGRAERLLTALDERPYLGDLAVRPLLLTLMTTLHSSWGQLPEDRADLYEEAVKLLLTRWQEARVRLGPDNQPLVEPGIAQALQVGEEQLRHALEILALQAHEAQRTAGARDDQAADIGEDQVLLAFKPLWSKLGEEGITTLLRYLQDRAGLLIERRTGVYAFPHRSFQEYLAAAALSNRGDLGHELKPRLEADVNWWREVALLGIVRAKRGGLGAAVSAIQTLLPRDVDKVTRPTAGQWRLAVVAAQAVYELRLPIVAAGREEFTAVVDRTRDWLVHLVEGGHLVARERVAAGDILGQIGDPRFAAAQWHLPCRYRGQAEPFFGFVEVPAGPFVMGSRQGDTDAYPGEFGNPPRLEIPYSYWMARYPVTVAQFGAFVDAGGYQEQGWWTAAGWQWRQQERRTTPDHWERQVLTPNRAVAWVSWYEGMAYAAWLDAQLHSQLPAGYVVRLPTEAEWEKAARCADDRRYPWGNSDWEEEKANIGESGIGHTTAVGAYPKGATPTGLYDLAGNVWEWTSSQDHNYPYAPTGQRNDQQGTDRRVVRGGSWYDNRRYARAAFRSRIAPDGFLFLEYVGLRVVVSLSSEF